MADKGAGTLLVGYAKKDLARRFAAGAQIAAGKCISCGEEVYVNPSGALFCRTKDVDLACYHCEMLYGADMMRTI